MINEFPGAEGHLVDLVTIRSEKSAILHLRVYKLVDLKLTLNSLYLLSLPIDRTALAASMFYL